MNTKLICSLSTCSKGNFICDNCLSEDKDHFSIHRNYIFDTKEFYNLQTNMT